MQLRASRQRIGGPRAAVEVGVRDVLRHDVTAVPMCMMTLTIPWVQDRWMTRLGTGCPSISTIG